MNIRQAILRAANHIGRHPMEFDFNSTETPSGPGCGTPGCAMGWLASFLGCDTGSWWKVDKALGCSTSEFYIRMDEMSGGGRPEEFGPYIPGRWRKSAAVCADALRLYADKYHPSTLDNFARDLTARLAASPRIAEDA